MQSSKRTRDEQEPQDGPVLLHSKRSRGNEEQCHQPGTGMLPLHGCHVSVGRREYQEDRLLVAPLAPAPSGKTRALFSVFDGHGGDAVSEHLAQHARDVVNSALEGSETHAEGLRSAFRTLDASLPAESSSQAGSTALVVVVDAATLTVANAGDSRAVLARGGKAVPLTRDHKPDDLEEEARIKEAGGSIITHCGVRRVMGCLSMTRAIGDAWLQQYGVTPDPEVQVFERQQADQFMVLASDGLWDALSNQEVVDIAARCMQRATIKGASRRAAAMVAAKVLVRVATDRGSRDNISVILVDLVLPGSPSALAQPAAATAPAQAVRRNSEPSFSGRASCCKGNDWSVAMPRLLSAERLSLLISASSAPLLIYAA